MVNFWSSNSFKTTSSSSQHGMRLRGLYFTFELKQAFFSSQQGVRLRRQFLTFELKLTLFFLVTWSKVAKVIPHLWVKTSLLFLCNLTWGYTTPLSRNRHLFLCNLAWGNIMPLSWNKTYFSFSTWHEDIPHLWVETDLLLTMSVSLGMNVVNMLRLSCGGGGDA